MAAFVESFFDDIFHSYIIVQIEGLSAEIENTGLTSNLLGACNYSFAIMHQLKLVDILVLMMDCVAKDNAKLLVMLILFWI